MTTDTPETTHSVREHKECGGSSADRWMNCTASVALVRNVPKKPPSESALEGTEGHELADIAVTDFLEHKLSGTDPDVRFDAASVGKEDEMIEAVKDYRDCIWEKVLNRSITHKAFAVEDALTYKDVPDVGGICDFWSAYINPKGKLEACVVDFKYGYQEVDVKDNFQLRFYLLLVTQLLEESGKKVEAGRICIFQPRCNSEPFKTAAVSMKQLSTFEGKMRKALNAIYVTDKTTYKIGYWCKWCPAMAICPKYAKQLQEKTCVALARPADKVFPPPDRLSDELLSNITLHLDDFRKFLDSCEEYAISRFMAGIPVPGTKVVETKGRRGWLKDQEMIGKTLIEHGVSDPYQKKLKTITEMSKLVPEAIMSKLTKVSDPRPLLVREDDERPAITAQTIKLLTEGAKDE